MSVSGTVSIKLATTGDEVKSLTFAAPANPASSAADTLMNTVNGANTITVPTGGATPTEAIIIPPPGNTNSITAKGVTGDTGIGVHKTRPTVLALDPGTSTFVLTTGGVITGLRIVWN